MHLGHYKVLIARHSFSSDASDEDLTPEFKAQRDELNYRQEALRQLRLAMLNYALERGYSFQRWQKVVNTVLFKDSDNVRLHRTRVIHIYEADFNLFLGIKWRTAMHQAEDFRLLNEVNSVLDHIKMQLTLSLLKNSSLKFLAPHANPSSSQTMTLRLAMIGLFLILG